jgi:hypothetical protein
LKAQSPNTDFGKKLPVIRAKSAWSSPEIEDFLDHCLIPISVACLTPNGAPIICSLWYLHDCGSLWCATQQTAKLVKHLSTHSYCGFEIAPENMPYKGVRGQGKATISKTRGPEILERLINRYLSNDNPEFADWLLARSDTEVAIEIQPAWLTSWDFSKRMTAG